MSTASPAYQQRVPYRVPHRPRGRAVEHDEGGVLVVGGGPVGLVLANLLAAEGHRVTLAEKREHLPALSMAIGITPPTLEILRRIGLDDAFIEQGVRVDEAKVYEGGKPLGEVHFHRLPHRFPFILSLPQRDNLKLLWAALRRHRTVTMLTGAEVVALEQDARGVTATLRTEGGTHTLRAAYVVGCDGHRSTVRRLSGIPFRTRLYRPSFAMADFPATPALGRQAHLYFGPAASVESFPLPGGRRRWIVRVGLDGSTVETPGDIARLVRKQAGVMVEAAGGDGFSAFRPGRALARSYARGRLLLCGDAAHVMSPIGGQGMNTGIADAEYLAYALTLILQQDCRPEPLLTEYTRMRQRAFRIASARAARGMWLGTRTGTPGSIFRYALIRGLLLRQPFRDRLAPYFAMLTIPFYNLSRCGLIPPESRTGLTMEQPPCPPA